MIVVARHDMYSLTFAGAGFRVQVLGFTCNVHMPLH